jgi:hypothetical protein
LADEPLIDDSMVAHRVLVAPGEVVFIKGLLEASEGLAALFAVRGGDLVLAAPRSRAGELAEFVRFIEEELGGEVVGHDG